MANPKVKPPMAFSKDRTKVKPKGDGVMDAMRGSKVEVGPSKEFLRKFKSPKK